MYCKANGPYCWQEEQTSEVIVKNTYQNAPELPVPKFNSKHSEYKSFIKALHLKYYPLNRSGAEFKIDQFT